MTSANAPATLDYDDLGFGITRIDSGMIRPGLAALYLLQSGGECALVETGTHHSIPAIQALLQQRGIAPPQLKYIIPTHVHLDHAGGVGGLMQCFPDATLLVHPKGARHLVDPAKLKAGAIAVYGADQFARVYGDVIPVDADRVQAMEDGAQVNLGDRVLTFHDTPGHARHHFCVQDALSNGLFTGDTFGLAYPELATAAGPFIIPTTTPVQFDPQALQQSIKRLLALQPERMFLTHYGVVEHPAPLGSALIEQIGAYLEIAARARREPTEQWEPFLRQQLTDYTFARAGHHGCTLDTDALQRVLGMDMELNAQGLAVWMRSQTG
ncbi:MBL fold metallo-hydrolase [Ketobacter sp.]|uniref:MBL fold metallo-hydrolase n=1 Tax=Ketobacter sp. TaxID=2083498 RepID=UPI000F29662C|nr:MBL fold metallo-hydrolase [Ketobacter sp.]RLU00956.1 MAG: MBL fold metallo-hydrolase [Ketobacter sp.]